jgi:hypothetical protein
MRLRIGSRMATLGLVLAAIALCALVVLSIQTESVDSLNLALYDPLLFLLFLAGLFGKIGLEGASRLDPTGAGASVAHFLAYNVYYTSMGMLAMKWVMNNVMVHEGSAASAFLVMSAFAMHVPSFLAAAQQRGFVSPCLSRPFANTASAWHVGRFVAELAWFGVAFGTLLHVYSNQDYLKFRYNVSDYEAISLRRSRPGECLTGLIPTTDGTGFDTTEYDTFAEARKACYATNKCHGIYRNDTNGKFSLRSSCVVAEAGLVLHDAAELDAAIDRGDSDDAILNGASFIETSERVGKSYRDSWGRNPLSKLRFKDKNSSIYPDGKKSGEKWNTESFECTDPNVNLQLYLTIDQIVVFSDGQDGTITDLTSTSFTLNGQIELTAGPKGYHTTFSLYGVHRRRTVAGTEFYYKSSTDTFEVASTCLIPHGSGSELPELREVGFSDRCVKRTGRTWYRKGAGLERTHGDWQKKTDMTYCDKTNTVKNKQAINNEVTCYQGVGDLQDRDEEESNKVLANYLTFSILAYLSLRAFTNSMAIRVPFLFRPVLMHTIQWFVFLALFVRPVSLRVETPTQLPLTIVALSLSAHAFLETYLGPLLQPSLGPLSFYLMHSPCASTGDLR